MLAAVVAVAPPAEVADTAGVAARLAGTVAVGARLAAPVAVGSAAVDIAALAAFPEPPPDAARPQVCLQPAALAHPDLGLGKAVAAETRLPAGISLRGMRPTPADPAR